MNDPRLVVRDFRAGDEQHLFALLDETFGSIEYLPRVRIDLARAGPDQQGLFVAEKARSLAGCIAIVSFPRKNWYDLRHLAIKDAFSNLQIGDQLVQKAVANVAARGYEYLSARTPSVQPYVEIYEKFHFTPVRRWLRLAWDLNSKFEQRKQSTTVRELSKDDLKKIGDMIVEGHHPYWDWWFEEQGGPLVKDWPGKFGFPFGTWLGSSHEGKITSLAGFLPDAYGPGEARLECFCVVPGFRGRGIGSTLLSETLDRAKQVGQKRLVIYTFAYIGSLPPGAVTYLKSGAKIEGEYLQLQRT